MFRPVSSRVNFPSLEEGVLRFWRERGIIEQSLKQREEGPPFVFYEGPPTANGNPGIHHVLARVFKDIIPRYRTMKGYYCRRRAGWDCHGLPVELEVERELGFTTKGQIEIYGVDRFNARCRESVFRYLKEWEELTQRIGFWVDLKDPYITLKNEYIESCWWIIRQLWDKGLIYRGHRVVPHCPRCGTTLSSHEVALGYKDDAQDPSVWVRFHLDLGRSPIGPASQVLYSPLATYFLGWTTTPWTLPGNTALAVALDADYAIVEYQSERGQQERLILADATVLHTLKGGYSVVATVKGADLVGLRYEPLFDPLEFAPEYMERFVEHLGRVMPTLARKEDIPAPLRFPVIAAPFVSLKEGTGIVHVAPAFGEVDYEAGQENQLFKVQPVDLEGKVLGSYPFSGLFVKDADEHVLGNLESRGLLFRREKIVHTYPFCWRCDSPLLYYAKPSYFIRTTAVKDQLIRGNREINWYPTHIQQGRFGEWLENNVDWALSRERYWGTPLPLWQCQGCGHQEWVGSIADLERLAHREAMAQEGHSLEECLKDLHRPSVDHIILKCPGQPGTSHYPDTMRRTPEVIDCWFDSGAMPVAQWHYPFENRDLFQEQFPADYICEAVDQTRGWFYTLHAISTLLFGQPCFRNVICLGHILDAKGEKMSKARGNVVQPWQVIRASGADALRWSMLTDSPPGSPRRFSPEQVQEVVRRFLLTLWNTYSFFVTYANLDGFDPTAPHPTPTSPLDRWALSELNQLIGEVDRELAGYDPTHAGRRIEEFVENLSTWYVRRSRRRFWKSENDADKQSAYFTLYHCLTTLCRLLAPFIPFTAEEMFQNLVRTPFPSTPESVHLTDFPTPHPTAIDLGLMKGTRLAIKLCSLGRAARSQAKIKVRQPLPRLLVKLRDGGEEAGVRPLLPQVAEELNVKAVEIVPEEAWLKSEPHLTLAEEGGYLVGVDTRVSPELAAEGVAREVVHLLQNMRRAAGFDIADRIITYYQGDEALEEVIGAFAPYIQQETLSLALVLGEVSDGFQQKHRIGGKEVLLGVKRA